MIFRHGFRKVSLAAVMVALWICAGCGSDQIPISGEVTFNGKPVQTGKITFEPIDRNGPTTGGSITDGKYDLTGNAAPLPGKKTVRILATRGTGRKIVAGPPLPPGTIVDEIERYIPRIYNAESTLTCEVSREGSKKIDFALKSP